MKPVKLFVHILAATTLLSVSTGASAASILFAHVDSDGSYFDDGNRIRDMLSGGGHTVTTRVLDQAVYTDYTNFDQIFVYDLYTGLDNTATQMSNYGGIADWYNGRTDQNLILDGRIISSDIAWTNPAETGWIQNYATQLDLRGGGLVLGTDHATAFTEGINNINDMIGVDQFTGFYYTQPLEAFVDPLSPLYVASLEPCSSSPADQCINDNSSTSFVATGAQANGQFLTPVAYHGTVSQAFDLTAVSSTIGSITFGTCDGPGQPPCIPPSQPPATSLPEPSALGLMIIGLLGAGFARRKRAV